MPWTGLHRALLLLSVNLRLKAPLSSPPTSLTCILKLPLASEEECGPGRRTDVWEPTQVLF